jgi:hypothetical protein
MEVPVHGGKSHTEFVLHWIRVMPRKNITVTVDPEVARWARLEAARREISVSRLLGELLKQKMLEEDRYEAAMRRALSRKSLPKSDGRYLTREEVHDRSRLR